MLDTSSGKVRQVTRPEFRDVRPAFDPDGEYLYFVSARVFDPVFDGHYFDLGFPRGSKPYLVPLRRDRVSPFAAATREPRGPEGATAPGQDDAEPAGKPKPPKVTIDFDGIEDRVVPFPVPEGRYLQVAGAGGRALFASEPVSGSLHADRLGQGEPTAGVRLEAWDFEKDKVELVCGGHDRLLPLHGPLDPGPQGRQCDPRTARDGEDRRPAQAGARARVGLGRPRSGSASAVVPPDEWRQMFREAWRLQRDHFWTPDMSGIDWQAVHDRYLPLVDRVGSRSEFSDLLLGDAGRTRHVSLLRVRRRLPPAPAWYQGFLGADLDYRARPDLARRAHSPRRRVGRTTPRRSPRRDSTSRRATRSSRWTARRSGASDRPSECLVAPGRPARSPHAAAQGRRRAHDHRADAPRRVRAALPRLGRGEPGARPRATKGRVGYVHIPDMGPRGFAEFHRYYLAEVERDGLIVDVRFNGGGHVSQLILEKLLRRRIGYEKPRWGEPSPTRRTPRSARWSP